MSGQGIYGRRCIACDVADGAGNLSFTVKGGFLDLPVLVVNHGVKLDDIVK